MFFIIILTDSATTIIPPRVANQAGSFRREGPEETQQRGEWGSGMVAGGVDSPEKMETVETPAAIVMAKVKTDVDVLQHRQ